MKNRLVFMALTLTISISIEGCEFNCQAQQCCGEEPQVRIYYDEHSIPNVNQTVAYWDFSNRNIVSVAENGLQYDEIASQPMNAEVPSAYFDFSDNLVTVLPNNATFFFSTHWDNINIDFDNNLIHELSAGFLAGNPYSYLVNAVSVHLNNNSISSLEPGVFQTGPIDTIIFYLEWNQISVFPSNVLVGFLGTYFHLHLGNNQITNLEPTAFATSGVPSIMSIVEPLSGDDSNNRSGHTIVDGA
eukprot:m.6833 g.6833  ORF g.6833 m.6833 type:complete len:244 (-) comp5448_c0_seq1:218-949(-)